MVEKLSYEQRRIAAYFVKKELFLHIVILSTIFLIGVFSPKIAYGGVLAGLIALGFAIRDFKYMQYLSQKYQL